MPKAQRERRERTDNYHLILQWCRTPKQRLYEGIRGDSLTCPGLEYFDDRSLFRGLAPHHLRDSLALGQGRGVGACGRIMAENRQLYGIKPPPKEPHQPKSHPFKAAARHERWCVDIRYLEKLTGCATR